MHRNHLVFFAISVLRSEKPICLKMQICFWYYLERIGENAIVMHFHAIVQDIGSSGGPKSIPNTNYS